MTRELLRYRPLIRNLVYKDLKLKYRGSSLGVAWSLLNPLLLLIVYTVAFKHVLRVEVPNYGYFLLVGLLPWSFFSGSLIASTGAITGNAHLLKKVYFPREILPIATVLFGFAQLILALAVFLPALVLVSGVTPRWSALLVLPLLLVHLLFTIGLAFLLSALTAAFRDVAHLTEVALLLLFWLTPIVYPMTMAPDGLQLFFQLSPLAALAVAYQDVLFWGVLPPASVVFTILAWTFGLLLIGHAVFRRGSPAFAEEV
ncbi:MAG: ABC transporter permease [Candidatus Rokuibacteriota bacterium]